MRKVMVFWLLLAFCWLAPAQADELSELKSLVRQLMEENRALAARVKALEKRLEAYESKAPLQASQPAAEEEKWYDRIEVGLSVAGVVQDVVDADRVNNDQQVVGHGDRGYAAVSVDLELSTSFSQQDRALVLLEMGSGHNPEDEVESFSGIIDEALSMVPVETEEGDVRISEAWYEHDFSLNQAKARLRFGKIDITTDFDNNEYANDENAQFISPVFVNNIAVEWPAYALGTMLWIETEKVDFGLGYADADGNWDDILDYPFLIAQVTVRPNFLGRSGNYRLYAWYNGDKHQEILGNDNDETGYGLGLSFDQEIASGVGLFLRYGWQDDEIYDYDQALSFGLSLAGNLWGRPDDVFGLGFGVAFLSDDYEDKLRSKGFDTEDEYHLEAYYRFQVNEYLALTPDLQWTDNPKGYEDRDDFWVFTVRGTWEF